MTCVECKKLRYDRMKQIGQEHYEECKQAYQQGKADAIEEFMSALSNYQTYDYHGNKIDIVEIAEQLKEHSND